MRTITLKTSGSFFVLALMAVMGTTLGLTGPAQAQEAVDVEKNIPFVGVEVRENTISPYFGLIHHMDDVLSDGFLVRLDGQYSHYEYGTTAVSGGNVEANAYAADVLLGYQKVLEGAILRGLVGPEYANHNLSPENVFDTNNDGDFGVKVRAEIETDYSTPYYASLLGSYGTAKEHYWTRLRLGYDFDGTIVGPEGSLEGNDQYQERRIGVSGAYYNLDPGLSDRFGRLFRTQPQRRGKPLCHARDFDPVLRVDGGISIVALKDNFDIVSPCSVI